MYSGISRAWESPTRRSPDIFSTQEETLDLVRPNQVICQDKTKKSRRSRFKYRSQINEAREVSGENDDDDVVLDEISEENGQEQKSFEMNEEPHKVEERPSSNTSLSGEQKSF